MAGILTQQVELSGKRLEIGIVTHAKYIRETIALLDKPQSGITLASAAKRIEPMMAGAIPAVAAISATAMGASR